MDALPSFVLDTSLLTHIQKEIYIEWHYNEAHHGKVPMDGIGGTVKNLVYRMVFSGDVVINTPKEFADFANGITNIDCLYLENAELVTEPEYVTKSFPIPSTLKIHKVKRVADGINTFSNHFFYLIEDLEPFHIENYGVQCGHRFNEVKDENFCQQCHQQYNLGEEWLKCPLCCQW